MYPELEFCVSLEPDLYDEENLRAENCFNQIFPIIKSVTEVQINGKEALAVLRYSDDLKRGAIQIQLGDNAGNRCSYLYDVNLQECEEFFNTYKGNLTTALNTLPTREG